MSVAAIAGRWANEVRCTVPIDIDVIALRIDAEVSTVNNLGFCSTIVALHISQVELDGTAFAQHFLHERILNHSRCFTRSIKMQRTVHHSRTTLRVNAYILHGLLAATVGYTTRNDTVRLRETYVYQRTR